MTTKTEIEQIIEAARKRADAATTNQGTKMNTDKLKSIRAHWIENYSSNEKHPIPQLLDYLIAERTPDKPIVVPLEEPLKFHKGNAAESADGECCQWFRYTHRLNALPVVNFCPWCGADKRERKG